MTRNRVIFYALGGATLVVALWGTWWASTHPKQVSFFMFEVGYHVRMAFHQE